MKKIITVLFAVFAMSSMFAYIPNKKNVEKKGEYIVYSYKYKDIYRKKKTSYITYNTKTGEIYISPYEYLEFLNKEYSVTALFIQTTERMWEVTDMARYEYKIFTEIAEKYHKKAIAKENLSIAKEIEKQFLDEYPFFTKENWLTLTKEEWNKMAKDFLENN